MTGRAVPDGISSPTEPVSRLGHSGFDPSRAEWLADAYEQAGQEDRQLDADLGELIGFAVQRRDPPFATTCRRRPSAVFEDARAVVPVSMQWAVMRSGDRYYAAVDRENDPFGEVYEGYARSPELALTAAALRARAAIATETRRAETTGSVEDEGAAPKGIAQ